MNCLCIPFYSFSQKLLRRETRESQTQQHERRSYSIHQEARPNVNTKNVTLSKLNAREKAEQDFILLFFENYQWENLETQQFHAISPQGKAFIVYIAFFLAVYLKSGHYESFKEPSLSQALRRHCENNIDYKNKLKKDPETVAIFNTIVNVLDKKATAIYPRGFYQKIIDRAGELS